jgi:Bacterial Ig-like domain (group 2)
MQGRSCAWALLLAVLVAPFLGCGSSTEISSIQVSPAAVSLAAGASAQLTATGIINHGSHPSTSQDITGSVTWKSSSASVATVGDSGEVTAVGAGTAEITATTNGFGGLIISNASVVTVTGGSSGGGGTNIVTTLSIIPSAQTVSSPQQTSQFIAIGTTSSGATVNVTNQAVWSSSSSQIATISSTGLATALSQGTTTITAIVTNSDNSVATATASFTVSGGASEPFTAITVGPSSLSLSASGQTGQLVALATQGSTGLNEDVTNNAQVTWTSSIPSTATVSSYPTSPAGLVSGVNAGNTTITATLKNPDGTVLTSSATVTVSLTAAPEPLLSLSILPTDISVLQLQDTGQFLAFGTYSTPPFEQDLTNAKNLTWLSSDPFNFPINTTGVAGAQAGVITAQGAGAVLIIAEAVNPDGTIATATSTFECPLAIPDPPLSPGSCYPGSQTPSLLATLTVFNAGLNQTDWLITAPSATGTPNVIHCGPGSVKAGLGEPVCQATYPIAPPPPVTIPPTPLGPPTTITLTAPAGTGQFGGWSSNCSEAGATAVGPNTCTVNLTTSDSVGGIFN